MITCLVTNLSYHNHVRKSEMACGRRMTVYMYKHKLLSATVVTKPGARPLWYCSRLYLTQSGATLQDEKDVVMDRTRALQFVNCVDCMASGMYGLLELGHTEI